MTSAYDNRIVSLGIVIDGEVLLLENLDIHATGIANTTPVAATATIVVSNLTREHRNYILTKATSLPKQSETNPVRVFLDVGRESYGTFRLFDGYCWAMGATQPPDIGIILDGTISDPILALIANVSFSGNVSLKTIAERVAKDCKLKLEFKVKNNKSIANYSYTGSVAKQVQKLAQMGDVKAYIAENKTLVVIDANETRGETKTLIDSKNGMIGVPQANAAGVIVRTLINNELKIGGIVSIKSEINPAVDGDYRVETIQFDVANRQNQFYYTLFCTNTFYNAGNQ